MKIPFIPPILILIAGASSLHGQSDPVVVNFSGLYGYNHVADPTRIVSGSGSLGAPLVGQELYWVCLDYEQDLPNPAGATTYEYTIGTVPSVSSGGAWADLGMNLQEASSASAAISNIYYSNEIAIRSSVNGLGSDSAAGTLFQYATWKIVRGFQAGIWEDSLDETALAALLAWDMPLGSVNEAQINTMLDDALSDAGDGRTVYFATPVLDNFQPVMFFLIPEPGTALLGTLSGMLLLVRRKRPAGA